MSKDIKLTNIQVPRDPNMAAYDVLKNAAPIDLEKYKVMGSVEEHDSVDSVIEKMIAKQEAARGVKIADKEPESKINLGGVVDDRKDKVILKR